MLDLLDAAQGLKTPQFPLLIGERGWRVGRRARFGFQPHAADVEVFLEAIGLEQVGEFEGADVAASFADFALEVSDDPAQVLWGEAGAQPFVPLPFAVKALYGAEIHPKRGRDRGHCCPRA